MTYRLRLDPVVHDIYASLPEEARRDLAVCLLDALADPIARSLPYGEDDHVIRTIARSNISMAIIIGKQTQTITVVQISYLG